MDIDEAHDTQHKHAMARKNAPFQLRAGSAFGDRLDDLRAAQRPMLSRAAFVRQLIYRLHGEQFPKQAKEYAERERSEGYTEPED